MMTRLSMKHTKIKPSPRAGDSSSRKPKVSARKSKNLNGDFKLLEPVNPHRQRITPAGRVDSRDKTTPLRDSEMLVQISNRYRQDSNDSSDPYQNIIIYGDP